MFVLNILIIIILGLQSTATEKKETLLEKTVIETLDFSLQQSIKMAESLADKPQLLPKTADRFGKLETCTASWWVSGFFPGQLWFMYEYSGDEKLKQLAENYTRRVQSQQFNRTIHDTGFMIFCSYGNGYRLTGNNEYQEVIYNAARSLASRYNSTTNTIRSWDRAEWNKQWQYPVILTI